MHQGCLDFDDARERSLDERFADYDRANPEIYREFVRLAHQVKAAGHKHYGGKGLIEVMRYHRAVDGRPGDPFKLNNVFTSRFVRKAIAEFPEFAEFFETRTLRSATQ